MSLVKVEIELGDLTDTCFVIMPFTSLFNEEYKGIIRPAIELAGLKCVRPDEIYSKPQVTSDIWKALRSSRIVIAELSGKNINVFYELGLAHALGKPTIIITRNEKDVPFDLKALRYLYYDINNPAWGDNLKNNLKEMILAVLKGSEYGEVFDDITVALSGTEKMSPAKELEIRQIVEESIGSRMKQPVEVLISSLAALKKNDKIQLEFKEEIQKIDEAYRNLFQIYMGLTARQRHFYGRTGAQQSMEARREMQRATMEEGMRHMKTNQTFNNIPNTNTPKKE
jgi:hypothetical protein